MSERPWYRLHWVAWVSACFVVLALYFVETRPTLRRSVKSGWPLVAAVSDDILWLPFIFDAVFCVAMVGSTALAMNRVARCQRFSLISLLGLVTTACALLAVISLEKEYFERNFDPHWEYYPTMPQFIMEWRQCILLRYPSIVGIPITLGLCCTINTAGWLAVRLVGRVVKRTLHVDQDAPTLE